MGALIVFGCFFWCFVLNRLVVWFEAAVEKPRDAVGRKCNSNNNSNNNSNSTTTSIAGKSSTATGTSCHDDVEKNQQYDPAIIGSDDEYFRPPPAAISETYTASYRESGNDCHTRTNLIFTPLLPPSNGLSIGGSGSDSDGTFHIGDGQVAPDGQAYWIEYRYQCDRQILSTGTFTTTTVNNNSDENTVQVSFQGRWRSNGVMALCPTVALLC
jgi:hypothetical protein